MNNPAPNESLALPTVPLSRAADATQEAAMPMEEQMPDAADDLPRLDVSTIVTQPLENPQDAGNDIEIIPEEDDQELEELQAQRGGLSLADYSVAESLPPADCK
jgi:hypothetical protein